MTALEQLGAFVATHQPDQRARAEVRLHTADTIGAWIAACGTAEGRALLAFRKDADGLADRVAINVALARLSEIDDIHLGVDDHARRDRGAGGADHRGLACRT